MHLRQHRGAVKPAPNMLELAASGGVKIHNVASGSGRVAQWSAAHLSR